MTSALELVSPVQQIQYPAKRFLAPLPLSLFGELEDESNGSLDEQSSPTSGQPTSTATSVSTTGTTSPPALGNGDDEDEFGDFEDEFGDFESVPAGTTGVIEATNLVSEPSPILKPDLRLPQAAHTGNGKPAELTHDFLADFGTLAVSPALTLAKSKPIVQEGLLGGVESVTGIPQIEISRANRPVQDFFGNFESPAISQGNKGVTRKPGQDTLALFEDFSSLSANGTHHVEPSGTTASAADGFDGFDSGSVRTVQIEPTVVRNTSVHLFEDFGSNTFFDVPKRGSMNGFEDLFGDFKAPPPVNTHPSWDFLNQSPENGLGPEPKKNVVNASEDARFDPLGISQFNFRDQNHDSDDVIFFSTKAEPNSQGSAAVSDDDWGDFVAPPPPLTSLSVKRTEVVSSDPFLVGPGDLSTNGGVGDFGLPNREVQSPEKTQFSGFLDSWDIESVDPGDVKGHSINGDSKLGSEMETSSQTPARAAPVKVDASIFYESQVSEFFPASSFAKPRKDGDSRRSRSVDLEALYANPSPVVKINNRAKSSVEHSAAPLSLSLFGEEEDTPQEAPELSLASSLNEFVGSVRHHDAENGDEYPGGLSSSSESQEDTDVDEFFLANADDLHKLTLWLLDEGRVQEALACSRHTAALLEFQGLQEDCSRALESGELDRASAITNKIEVAHAKLAKPEEWHRWQKRQRHENGFKHGTTPIVPKLTYEDMMSLLGGISDPRGVYFRSHFQSDEIDSLAKKDLRAAAEHHTRALETFHLLISATIQEQLLYVKAWSALASSCASELELGMIFWQRAVQAQSQSHLLTHRKGRNYFAALGQVYSVFLILEATVRLHAPWLEVAGEKGKAIHRLIDQCRSCWVGSGLKDAVYWALSEANDSLPSTRTSWQGILDLSIAVNLASLKHSKAETQPVCGLSLLPIQTLPGIATLEWAGRHYFLPLANMWANCVECEPPRLPVLGLQQTV